MTSDITTMCYVLFTGVSGIARVKYGVPIFDVVNGRIKPYEC